MQGLCVHTLPTNTHNNTFFFFLFFPSGHKCKGSVYATLQDKGWAMGVSAGASTEYDDDFSVFEVSIALTGESESESES